MSMDIYGPISECSTYKCIKCININLLTISGRRLHVPRRTNRPVVGRSPVAQPWACLAMRCWTWPHRPSSGLPHVAPRPGELVNRGQTLTIRIVEYPHCSPSLSSRMNHHWQSASRMQPSIRQGYAMLCRSVAPPQPVSQRTSSLMTSVKHQCL